MVMGCVGESKSLPLTPPDDDDKDNVELPVEFATHTVENNGIPAIEAKVYYFKAFELIKLLDA